jgi:hypothetical protein
MDKKTNSNGKKMVLSEMLDNMFNVFTRNLKAYSQEDFEEFMKAREEAKIQLSKM